MSSPKLPDKSTKIPKSTYALLFSEVVQYCHQKVNSLEQFSKQLKAIGYPIGCTILEVMAQSSQPIKRYPSEVPTLIQIREKIWPFLFGYQANDLEQQVDDANCYMLYDNKPMIVKYISHPQDIKNHFSCCSFVAGIVEGILCSSGFPCQVSTHPSPEQNAPERVIYLIKFSGASK